MRNMLLRTTVAATALFALAPPALAAPSFSGLASGVLRLTGVEGTAFSNLLISGEAMVSSNTVNATDSGSAVNMPSIAVDAADPLNFAVGDGFTLAAETDGAVPADGSAAAGLLTDGTLFVTNLSDSESASLNFSLAYDLLASVEGAAGDAAIATASVIVADLGGVLGEWVLTAELAGERAASLTDTFLFTLALAPLSEATLFLNVDVDAFAAAADAPPVPAPAALWLLAPAALALALHRRRRL